MNILNCVEDRIIADIFAEDGEEAFAISKRTFCAISPSVRRA